MLYALICTDKPGSLPLRKANRPDHLAYLESLGETLVFAGPFTEPDGQTMNGSLIVVEARLARGRAQDRRRRSVRQGRACSPPSRSARGCGPSTIPTRRSERQAARSAMAYWLLKSEAETWSWDQQKKAGAKGAEWTACATFRRATTCGR